MVQEQCICIMQSSMYMLLSIVLELLAILSWSSIISRSFWDILSYMLYNSGWYWKAALPKLVSFQDTFWLYFIPVQDSVFLLHFRGLHVFAVVMWRDAHLLDHQLLLWQLQRSVFHFHLIWNAAINLNGIPDFRFVFKFFISSVGAKSSLVWFFSEVITLDFSYSSCPGMSWCCEECRFLNLTCIMLYFVTAAVVYSIVQSAITEYVLN